MRYRSGSGVRGHVRFAKFALVGFMGVGVQFAVLAGLSATGLNYLLATSLAVESAVLHNFFWHMRFTWSDRSGLCLQDSLFQLLRFNLSNGAISLLGNLILMRLLSGGFGLPVFISNLIAIAACSLANFTVGDRWVFRLTPS